MTEKMPWEGEYDELVGAYKRGHDFKVGDLVRLAGGKKPQVVVKVAREKINVRYLGSNPNYDNWKMARHFVPFEQEQETENTEMAKLYEVIEDGKTLFGIMLAQNSKGRLVLEMKGSGEVRDFDPKEVSEVVPHTVEITIHVPTKGATSAHFKCTPDSLKVGDFVVFANGGIGRVTKTDTKSPTGQSLKNARRLVTEAIGELPAAPGDEE